MAFPKKQQTSTAILPAPIMAQRNSKPKWFIFPDELPNGEFRGLETRKDATQVRGAYVLGQNVKFRDAGLPTLREGYAPVGTEATDATPTSRAWTFETRTGDVFEIKAYSTFLYYFLVGTSTEYALLKGGFTSGLEFGYANIGESSGEFHSFFCNGTDPWYEWNGASATVAAVTANTIQKTGGGTFQGLPVPFYNTGTRSVVVNGVTFAYTGGDATDTLTGVTPDPTANGVVAGQLIVQAPRAPTFRIFFPLKQVATGTFTVGETVTGGTSGKTAKVQRMASDGTFLVVTGASGTFLNGETVTGGSSGATGVLSSIDMTSGPPLSSVITSHLSRVHCWSATTKSMWAFSVLDDPYCWSVFPADTSGGRKDIDFGGAGTAFGRLNETILGYKKRGIVSLDFVQTGQRTDVPRYTSLIQADSKGTTLGAIGQRSTFSSPYGMISMTEDSKMILLKAISQNNQPDYEIISDPIQPIFTRGNHLDASAICVDGVLWYAFKSDNTVTANDTVLTGDLRRRTVDAYGNSIPLRWDTPYVAWQIKDFTAVPKSTGGTSIHGHSSLSSSSYLIDPDSKEDNGGSFTATVRTWAEVCGAPEIRKQADRAFVEIRMRENSVIAATILLDEEGFTDQISKTLRGDDTAKRFGTDVFNPIGASVFGSQKIGSNGSVDDRKLYRFYFELKTTLWFFNLSLQLSTSTENGDFELVRWGVHVVNYESNTPKALAI